MNQDARHQNASVKPRSEIQGVPLLDLGRHTAPLQAQFSAALQNVCQSGAFVLGPEVKRLEGDLADYCQCKHAVGCASGSDALLLALMACGVEMDDEVILPSFTFFATASAVTRLGARPVFADIDPVTFNLDPSAVASLISPATKAVIPVHLFGQAAEMDPIIDVARKACVAVVEDAAQAVGAELSGRRAGSMGDIGCFSFYPTKNLGGAGDGGMLTTNDESLADRLTLLRLHGMRPRYYHQVVGINSRLDSFQAAVLNVKLPHLDRWTQMRQENAALYTDLFVEAGLDDILGLPKAAPNRRHVWNQYVIRVPGRQRDALREHLRSVNVGTEIYYPVGLHQQQCFRQLGYRQGDLSQTERAAEEVLALPIFPELTADEQRYVVQQTAVFFGARRGGHRLAGPKFLTRSKQQRSAENSEG